MKPTYLYGIIPTDNKIIFDEVCGMDDDEDEVYTFPLNGIAAVVGASPLTDYRGLKRDQAMRYLVIHQRVVEAVLNHFTVLPVKFGTVLSDLSHLERMLYQGQAQFKRALSSLQGLTQMEVVMMWDMQRVFQEISQDEAIVQMKAQLAQQPADPTVDPRVVLGRMVKETLERRRSALGEQVAPQLRALARDNVANPILNDTIVVNLALLLDADGRKSLDTTLSQLDKAYNGQYTFRSVGPLPPYSFATVDVQTPSFEMVEACRELLACGSTVTLDEIKRAYYQAAKQVHPDLNNNGKGTEARMTALTQAYKLLTSVAESQVLVKAGATDSAQGAADDFRCCLDRAAVENMLLISVRRQETNPQSTGMA